MEKKLTPDKKRKSGGHHNKSVCRFFIDFLKTRKREINPHSHPPDHPCIHSDHWRSCMREY